MKCAEYKIAKSFKEVINDGGKNLYEIFVIGKNGYAPKRLLCKMRLNMSWDTDVITITPFDKFGRVIYGWQYPYRIPISSNVDTKSDIIESNNVYSLSRDKAYQHCMQVLRNEAQKLRKKQIQIHDLIYKI